ncbi:MAG: lipopolysaccharide biosynthesis protein [Bacteroidota bacterium]
MSAGPDSDTGPDAGPEAQAPSLTRSTLGGLLWNFSGAGVQALLRIGVLLVLARLLTPADFGVVSAALVVVYFSEIFSQLGIGPALVQRPGLSDDHLRTGFTVSTLCGVALAGVVVWGAPAMAAFFRMPPLADVLRVLAWVFPLKGLALVAESLLYRELQFRWIATRDVLAYFVGYGLVGLGLAFGGFGVWALVWAHLAETVVRTGVLLAARRHPKRPQVALGPLRELVYYGGGFTVARISNYVAQQGNNLIIGRLLGASALGLYGRAFQLTTMPVILAGGVLDKVLFPAMAKIQGDAARLRRIFLEGTSVLNLLTLPLSAASVALAPEIVGVLLGPDWLAAVVPFQVLALGMMLRTSYKIGDALARATGAVYNRAWRKAVYAGCVLAGSLAGSAWGIEGVAVGILLALVGNFFLVADLSLRLTGVTWGYFLRMHVPPLLLAALVFGTSFGLAEVLRSVAAPAALVALSGMGAAGLLSLGLVLAFPAFFVGADGLRLIGTLLRHLPARFQALGWAQRFRQTPA